MTKKITLSMLGLVLAGFALQNNGADAGVFDHCNLFGKKKPQRRRLAPYDHPTYGYYATRWQRFPGAMYSEVVAQTQRTSEQTAPRRVTNVPIFGQPPESVGENTIPLNNEIPGGIRQAIVPPPPTVPRNVAPTPPMSLRKTNLDPAPVVPREKADAPRMAAPPLQARPISIQISQPVSRPLPTIRPGR